MAEDDKPQESQGPSPVWCVAANVRGEIPFGEGAVETRRGTRKFHGGAKVYLAGAYWGMGAMDVTVIGNYRGKGYITCSLKSHFLTNWRVELVYSPAVLSRIGRIRAADSFEWDAGPESKAKAEHFAEMFQKASDERHNERLAKRQASQDNTSGTSG